ncbi:MAG: hypothetical protein ABW133_07185 [Polyangiaceae bacterium]
MTDALRWCKFLLIPVLAGAVIYHFVGRRQRAPLPESRTHAPTVLTDRAFDSEGSPALALEAPAGWRIEFDSVHRLLRVVRDGEGEIGAVMQINSTVLSEDANIDQMLAEMSHQLQKQRMSVGDAFTESIDGKHALGVTLVGADERKCIWLVKRQPRYVSAVLCATRERVDIRQVCRPALERIKWREPIVD